VRTGDAVTYRDSLGVAHVATVAAVVGSGASRYKVLDLSYWVEGVHATQAGVPHVGDAVQGGDYWYLGELAEPVVEEAPAITFVYDAPTEYVVDQSGESVVVRDVVSGSDFPDSE
jgi:hypothetical protein